jgi:hypothetical protein
VRVWDSVTLNTLHIIGIGFFDRAVTCIAFSKSVSVSRVEMAVFGHREERVDLSRLRRLRLLPWCMYRLDSERHFLSNISSHMGLGKKRAPPRIWSSCS